MFIMIIFLLFFQYCYGSTYDNALFPMVGNLSNINTSFPLVYKVESNSNYILIRCPGEKYRHGNESMVKYELNSRAKRNLIKSLSNNKVVWIKISNSNQDRKETNFTCGKLIINSKHFNGTIYWNLSIKWKFPPYNLMNISHINVKLNKWKIPISCNTTDPYTFYNKNKSFLPYNHKEDKIYKDEVIYFFNKNILINTTYNYASPCGVYKAALGFPNIEIMDKIVKIDVVGKTKIHVINDNSFGYYHAALKTKGVNKFFFKKEEIKVFTAKFDDTFGIVRENSISVNKNKFKIQKTNLIVITYACDTCHKTIKSISKVFFFELNRTRYPSESKTIGYRRNELMERPNCRKIIDNYKFLIEMSYGNDKIILDNFYTLGVKEKFIVKKNMIEYRKNNILGEVRCVYRTPGSKEVFKIVMIYIHYPEEFILKDSAGNVYYPSSSGYAKLYEEQMSNLT
uniref:Uncharacterized protein n=1 Tax=Parastrongyloides trichosuri TaxID=131310 RepID=A0A0N4ZGN2_PARTI